MLGRPVEKQQLHQAEAQGGQYRGVQALGRPARELGENVVERGHALHGAVGQGHGEGALARIELFGLGVERAVGVGALLEHAAHDGIGADTSRGDPRDAPGGRGGTHRR